jgi:hypothetical protein
MMVPTIELDVNGCMMSCLFVESLKEMMILAYAVVVRSTYPRTEHGPFHVGAAGGKLKWSNNRGDFDVF